MDIATTQIEVLPRLGLAVALSGMLGWEREAAQRPAGLRTHILVGTSAAVLMSITGILVADLEGADHVRLDPIRMVQAIVTGIGFIGGGTIFVSSSRRDVHGLTTAASLLAVATVGVVCGLGLYILASTAAVLAVVVLRGLSWLEQRMLGTLERDEYDDDQGEGRHGRDREPT